MKQVSDKQGKQEGGGRVKQACWTYHIFTICRPAIVVFVISYKVRKLSHTVFDNKEPHLARNEFDSICLFLVPRRQLIIFFIFYFFC